MNFGTSVLDLPQKYPFLLVDKVVSAEIPNRIVAIKNVSINEPYFVGHFPGNPIMPGVLIIEAMAQTASILMNLNNSNEPSKGIYMLGAVKRMNFKLPVYPGDQLVIEVIAEKIFKNAAIVKTRANVSDHLIASGTLMFSRKGKEQ